MWITRRVAGRFHLMMSRMIAFEKISMQRLLFSSSSEESLQSQATTGSLTKRHHLKKGQGKTTHPVIKIEIGPDSILSCKQSGHLLHTASFEVKRKCRSGVVTGTAYTHLG